jgi:hypothetical protein
VNGAADNEEISFLRLFFAIATTRPFEMVRSIINHYSFDWCIAHETIKRWFQHPALLGYLKSKPEKETDSSFVTSKEAVHKKAINVRFIKVSSSGQIKLLSLKCVPVRIPPIFCVFHLFRTPPDLPFLVT